MALYVIPQSALYEFFQKASIICFTQHELVLCLSQPTSDKTFFLLGEFCCTFAEFLRRAESSNSAREIFFAELLRVFYLYPSHAHSCAVISFFVRDFCQFVREHFILTVNARIIFASALYYEQSNHSFHPLSLTKELSLYSNKISFRGS